MSILDIIIIAIIVSFTLVSSAWGIIRQVMAIAGLILGLILAGALNEPVSIFLGFIDNPTVAKGVAFIGIVMLVSLAASIIASILYFVVGLLFLGFFDHALGAVLGLVQGLLVTGILLIGGLLIIPDWMTTQINSSVLANKLVTPFTNISLLVVPGDLKSTVQDIIQTRLPGLS